MNPPSAGLSVKALAAPESPLRALYPPVTEHPRVASPAQHRQEQGLPTP